MSVIGKALDVEEIKNRKELKKLISQRELLRSNIARLQVLKDALDLEIDKILKVGYGQADENN